MDLVAVVLIVCGVITAGALAFAAARYWGASRHADEVLQRVAVLGREGRIDEALGVAHALPGAVSAVLLAGLPQADEAVAEAVMAETAAARRLELGRPATMLEWAASASILTPAAGLVGAIAALAPVGGTDLVALLGLMRPALGHLAGGLAIAAAATLGRFWLLSRIRRLAIDMEKGAAVVYNTAR